MQRRSKSSYRGLRKKITIYDEHFHCNKECWRDRVRMFCPKRSVLTRDVSLIERFVRDNQVTKEYQNDDLNMWFKDFISKYNQGYFEYMKDVSCYKWNILDSYCLNLWLQLRGSNRYDNYHQKLELEILSWIFDPILGHFILFTFRCNVKFNVKGAMLLILVIWNHNSLTEFK